MTTREEMSERLEALFNKRIAAFAAGGPNLSTAERLALLPEATTLDDLDTVSEAVAMLDDFSRQVAYMHADIQREYGKYRCSVCGRTPKQSEAIGYDCVREC